MNEWIVAVRAQHWRYCSAAAYTRSLYTDRTIGGVVTCTVDLWVINVGVQAAWLSTWLFTVGLRWHSSGFFVCVNKHCGSKKPGPRRNFQITSANIGQYQWFFYTWAPQSLSNVRICKLRILTKQGASLGLFHSNRLRHVSKKNPAMSVSVALHRTSVSQCRYTQGDVTSQYMVTIRSPFCGYNTT